MKTLRLAAAALALGLIGLASAGPALAIGTYTDASGVKHLSMDSSVTPQIGIGGFDGTLKLAISPDGIVNGLYTPDGGVPHQVTGGVEGDRIWLDIGLEARLHIVGTLSSDRIVGSTVIDSKFYNFAAKITG